MSHNELDRLFSAYVKHGDEHALDLFVRRSLPLLLRWARHLGARHAADDLVQNTFVTLLARAHRLDHDRPILPWLLGVLSRHRLRLQRNERIHFGPVPERMSNRENPAILSEWQETSQLVRATIEQLPATYRPVLSGFLLDQLTAHELARFFGVPESSTRSRIFRGLRMLRDRLRSRLTEIGCYAGWRWRTRGGADALARMAPVCKLALVPALLVCGLWAVARSHSVAERSRSSSLTADRSGSTGEASHRRPAVHAAPVAVRARTAVAPFPDSGVRYHGVVKGRSGEPVADAELHLFTLHADGPRPRCAEIQAVTDEHGCYEFDRPWQSVGNQRDLLFAYGADGSIGWSIAPLAGERERAEVPIQTLPEANLVVVVETAGGQPVSGAEIELLPTFAPWPDRGASWREWLELESADAWLTAFRGRTGAAGTSHHRVPLPERDPEHILPGGSQVIIAPADYVVRGSHPELRVLSQRVLLRDQNTAEVRLIASPAESRRVHGFAQNFEGRALVGAQIRIEVPDSLAPPKVLFQTDAMGRFHGSLEALPEPPFQWVCVAPGHLSARVLWSDFPAELDPELTFRLRPGRALPVTVRDGEQRPVPGALVQWSADSASLRDPQTVFTSSLARYYLGVPLDPSGVPMNAVDEANDPYDTFRRKLGSVAAVTDVHGRCSIMVPMDGDGLLVTQPPSPLDEWLGAGVRPLTDRESPTLTEARIFIHRRTDAGNSLAVHAVDEEGRPWALVDAYLAPDRRILAALPVQTRLFEQSLFVGTGSVHSKDLLPGHWTLWIHAGHSVVSHEFEVTADDRHLEWTQRVPRPRSLNGRVRMQDGQPIPTPLSFRLRRDADIMTPNWAQAAAVTPRIHCDEHGRFRVAELAAGTWTLSDVRPPHVQLQPTVLQADVESTETFTVFASEGTNPR